MINSNNFSDNCLHGRKIKFKYNNKFYVINKPVENLKDIDNNKYYFLDVENNSYLYFDNYVSLSNNAALEGKALRELKDAIEIISVEYDKKKEFLYALKFNNEIEFFCGNSECFKTNYSVDGVLKHAVDILPPFAKWGENKETTQYFDTIEDLEKDFHFDGKPLNKLWDIIEIKCIL
ncbi:MAG: hypothetical protein LUG66_03675 [Clostridiales bacterium]|nr:hypothetical protein [Clostridiales bacterium]